MTHSVGQELPNPWDLYDMNGNVGEWCMGWSFPYPGGTARDPHGHGFLPRSGAFSSEPASCRAASRPDFYYNPQTMNPHIGFRVVLAPDQP